MAITIVQERVVLLSPAGGATTVFAADGDEVLISNTYPDCNGWEERTTIDGAHEVFNYLFEQGWR